jgi:hypothetical protein
MSFDDYKGDILAFCELLGSAPWTPSEPARVFLRAVERGYARVGCAGAEDGWRAMAAACLWNACCHPERLQLVMAGTTKSGQNWVRYLKQIVSDSSELLLRTLLFTEDDSSILVIRNDEPVLAILTPGLLLQTGPRLPGARPTVLVMPDLDRVPSKWFPALKCFVEGPDDRWLTVAPVRP